MEVFEGHGKLVDARGRVLFEGPWDNTSEVVKNDGSREVPLFWPRGGSPNGVTFFRGIVPKAHTKAAVNKTQTTSSGAAGGGAAGGSGSSTGGRYGAGGGRSGNGGYASGGGAAGDGYGGSSSGSSGSSGVSGYAGCGAAGSGGYASGGGAGGSYSAAAGGSGGNGKRKSMDQGGNDNKKQKKQPLGVPAADSTMEAVQKAKLAVCIAEKAEENANAAFKQACKDKKNAREIVQEQQKVKVQNLLSPSLLSSSSSSSSSRPVVDKTYRETTSTANDVTETYSGQCRASGSNGVGVKEGYGIFKKGN